MNGTQRRKTSPRRRLLFIAAYLAFVALLLFVAFLVVLKYRANVPLTGEMTELDVWKSYYPGLERSTAKQSLVRTNALDDTDDDKHFDVLFLGASVLEQVVRKLKPSAFEPLANGQSVRLYNLTMSAHTTRDSLLKLRLLKHREFDLIIVYHGINDARMNCFPGDEFQQDYSHCAWYSGMLKRVKARRITFTDVVSDATERLIPLGEPDEKHAAFGSEIKTDKPFKANLTEIVDLAAANESTRVVFMTFATFVPNGYSKEKHAAGELGYAEGDYDMTLESWGQPDAVQAAVAAHNRVVREVAGASDRVTLIDLDETMSGKAELFSDPCHLSARGCKEFDVRLMVGVLKTN